MEEVIDKILKKSPYDTEINLDKKTSSVIRYDRFTIPLHEESAVLQIRVTRGNRYGYSSTSDLKKWNECLKKAIKIMKVSKPLELEPKLPGKQKYERYPLDRSLYSMSYEELSNSFEKMFDIKPRVTGASILKIISESFVANSKGLRCSFDTASFAAGVEVKYKGATAFGGKADRKPFDVSVVSSEAEKFCLRSVNPHKIKSMTVDVVFDYFALSSLVSLILLPAFYADRVQRHESFFSDKLGQKVFSDSLTIIDDGTKGLVAAPCDHEGAKTQRKTLVNRGVISGFLYDCYSAQKENTESTANCSSLVKRPSIGPTNFIIKPGNSKIISSDCLFVRSISGAHTANPVSGDFSVSVDSAFYEGKAVKHAMISGNIFKLFSRVDSIGKTSRQEDIINTPPIRFNDVRVIN